MKYDNNKQIKYDPELINVFLLNDKVKNLKIKSIFKKIDNKSINIEKPNKWLNDETEGFFYGLVGSYWLHWYLESVFWFFFFLFVLVFALGKIFIYGGLLTKDELSIKLKEYNRLCNKRKKDIEKLIAELESHNSKVFNDLGGTKKIYKNYFK